ncbi:MAG: SDR family oxidoreductase [Fuerstiella sp.]|nr:SDR family oxidoreductase [Fuerstiella sp.]
MAGMNERIALVTGAGRGIGRAIAEALASAGCTVVAAARTVDELRSVVEDITQAGGNAVALEVDLSDRDQTKTLPERAAEQAGPVDILVNNAGVGSSGDPRPFVDFRDQYWDLSLEVNLTVPYLLTKLTLPHMLEQGWGRVITIASVNGRRPALHGSAYTASKHGVIGLMRAVALEVAAQGVTVNCICPGPVKTLMNDLRIQYDADRLGRDLAEHEQGLTPVGGRLVPEDIAPMAVYLAGDESHMVTGQAWNICGGLDMA